MLREIFPFPNTIKTSGLLPMRYADRMNVITVEVDIDHGRIVARQPEKLPAVATGILTILPPTVAQKHERVKLPLIQGDGTHTINPTREQLDAALWDE